MQRDVAGRIDWLLEYCAAGELERYTDYDQDPLSSHDRSSCYNLYDGTTGAQTQKFVTCDGGNTLRQGFGASGARDWQEERRADSTLAFYTDWDLYLGSMLDCFVNYHHAAGDLYARRFVYDDGSTMWL